MKRPLLSRRHFLQTTALSLAAPTILSSSVWSAEKRKLPSDRIVLGFIGMGTQARGLMNGFIRRNDTQVVAVCDVDSTRREHAKKTVEDFYAKATDRPTFKGCSAYNDFRELLERKDLDAVVIATPDHWHAIPVIAAANKRLDIYCEKPLSYSIHEARAMAKAVRKNKVIFQTGSQQRSSKEFRQACELVRNGRLGKLERIEVAVGGPSKWCDLPEEPAEPGLDWNFWLGPAPMRVYNSVLSPRGVHTHFPNWRGYREYSGGAMTDWGAHHFDIAQWALGMDESGPVEIIPPADPHASFGAKFIYGNGIVMEHTNGNGVTFHGSNGKIYVNRGKFEATPADLAKEPIGEKEIHLYKSDNHLGNWIDCIRSRQLPICDVEVGARSVTVCHLGNLAYWNRRPLKWDPKKEKFIGDAQANQWLNPPKRAPWKV
ncbi:MAG: Gfo/Idh/MocA family oxidoreductase [Verrucomicrobiota bacterium]